MRGADLVGHVSVGGDPVTPDDHRVHRSGGDQAGRGAVDDQFVCDPEPGEFVGGQTGALQQGAGLGRQD